MSQVVPQPVMVGQFGATIMKNAPHPNAARLIAGFLASPEGKAARQKATSQADYGPTSDNELAKALHSGAMQVVWDRPDNMAAKRSAVRPGGRHLDRAIELRGGGQPLRRIDEHMHKLDNLDFTAKLVLAVGTGAAIYLIAVPLGDAAVRGVPRVRPTICRSSPARAGRSRMSSTVHRIRVIYTRILPDTFVFVAGTVVVAFAIGFALAWLDRAHRPAGSRNLVRAHSVSVAGAGTGAGHRLDLSDGTERRLAQSRDPRRRSAWTAPDRSISSAWAA